MPLPSEFLFVTCQAGAEGVLKAEVAREWPDFRLSFSRKGFVTFKLPEGVTLADDFDLRSTFARTYGFSLGKVRGEDGHALAEQAAHLAASHPFDQIHAWQRDTYVPGEGGFEPGATPLAEEAGLLMARASAPAEGKTLLTNRTARAGQSVLDCVLVEPNEWWIGWHRASSLPSRWPGGVPWLDVSHEVVSRAYFKMSEAIRWSKLPVAKGDLCVEIGSAPGGAAQWLLERGLSVIGIDPAEMDERVLADPNFTWMRKRASEVRRRDLTASRWLFADSNVAPKHTLDSVEGIVTHDGVHVRGLLLTLKLIDWQMAEEIPAYLERIRSWGYRHVRARQLAFNRQEICVSALKNRAMRRFSPARIKRTRKSGQA